MNFVDFLLPYHHCLLPRAEVSWSIHIKIQTRGLMTQYLGYPQISKAWWVEGRNHGLQDQGIDLKSHRLLNICGSQLGITIPNTLWIFWGGSNLKFTRNDKESTHIKKYKQKLMPKRSVAWETTCDLYRSAICTCVWIYLIYFQGFKWWNRTPVSKLVSLMNVTSSKRTKTVQRGTQNNRLQVPIISCLFWFKTMNQK